MNEKKELSTKKQKYKIAWLSEITEAQGCGTGEFDYEEAKAIAEALNKEITFMRHTAVPA